MKIARNFFERMVSLNHLFYCWDQFKRGKRKRKDVQAFERNLEDNIFQLENDLITFRYVHASYEQFYVSDPKQRHISKASVRDRLVHHMVYNILTAAWDKTFMFHSLSSRRGKGTHMGVHLLNLKLELHPNKVVIRKLCQGIDFLGYILFEKYVLVRTRTKRRMKKKLKNAFEWYLTGKITGQAMDRRVQSYLGVLSHANQHALSQAVKNAYWVRNT